MLNISPDIFNRNLLLTQKYCHLQLTNTDKNNASIFRSFNPIYKEQRIFRFRLSKYGLGENVNYCFLTDWTTDPMERKNESLIQALFANQIEFKKGLIKGDHSDNIFIGEILIANIDETVIDGASAVQSAGLIDDFDCPPIDTWFYHTQGPTGQLIFSWIPFEFVKFADNAVLVNCVDCIRWFKDWFPDDYKVSMTNFAKFDKSFN